MSKKKSKNIEVKIDGVVYQSIIAKNGVQRFSYNKLYRHLVDSGQVDLNKLSRDYQEKKFTLKEYMEFYRGLGYSVCGYLDIFRDKIKEIEYLEWDKSKVNKLNRY